MISVLTNIYEIVSVINLDWFVCLYSGEEKMDLNGI